LIALLCFSTLQNFHKQSRSFIFSANLAVLKKYKIRKCNLERKHQKNRIKRSNSYYSIHITFFNYCRKYIIKIVGFIKYRDLLMEHVRFEYAEADVEKFEDTISNITMSLFPMQVRIIYI
jgi:hypothetical protein